MVIAVGNDSQFPALCQVLGIQRLADDERFQTNPDRVKNRAELIPILQAALLTKTTNLLVRKMQIK